MATGARVRARARARAQAGRGEEAAGGAQAGRRPGSGCGPWARPHRPVCLFVPNSFNSLFFLIHVYFYFFLNVNRYLGSAIMGRVSFFILLRMENYFLNKRPFLIVTAPGVAARVAVELIFLCLSLLA